MDFFKRAYAFLTETKGKKILFYSLISVFFLALLTVIGFLAFSPSEPPSVEAGADPGETTEPESVSTETVPLTGEGTATITDPFPDTPEQTIFVSGIDVSSWQGTIDWKKVKEAGIGFAMIRIGSFDGGKCVLDERAVYNLQQAEKHGVLAGVYFYSGAKLPQDAREEAKWVLNEIAGLAVSYPVALDWEMDSYKKDVSAAVRTDTALAFLQEIENAGYEAMLYTPQGDFENSAIWQKDRILEEYPVWVARYSDPGYPAASHPDGNTAYAMWQYSDEGTVSGISGNVDLNVAYFERSYSPPKDESRRPPEEETPADFKQTFRTVSQKLTAKNYVNLRKIPSTDGEIVGALQKGEFLECNGISDMGWARLLYQGQTVYAVYSYLSESVIEEVVDPAAGHTFEQVSQEVTAKEEVNLRSAPSTDSSEVVATILNGEYVLRTGIGDKGWDRLEYKGQTVYAVHSLLTEKETTAEE